jgi:hypothetical protein
MGWHRSDLRPVAQQDEYTVVLFGHRNWREAVEFTAHCSMKWATFLLSLRDRSLKPGKGRPAPGRPQDRQLELAMRVPLATRTHIETAADFHHALVAGVDEIAHMPGFRGDAAVRLPDPAIFEISDADARLAARLGTVVVTAPLATG